MNTMGRIRVPVPTAGPRSHTGVDHVSVAFHLQPEPLGDARAESTMLHDAADESGDDDGHSAALGSSTAASPGSVAQVTTGPNARPSPSLAPAAMR